VPRNPNAPQIPLHPRASFDSFVSVTSTAAGGNSNVYMPRRVESIMGDEDRRKYFVAQSNQKEAGGAYMMEPRNMQQQDGQDVYSQKLGMDSVDSLDSANFGAHGYGHSRENSYTTPYNHSRNNSYTKDNYSIQLQNISPAASTPGTPGIGEFNLPSTPAAGLQVPEPVATRAGPRSGRSPLARNSLIRTADEGNDADAEESTTNTTTPQESGASNGTSSGEDDRSRSRERKGGRLTKRQN